VLLRRVQLAASVGGSVVRGLSGLDAWLEDNKVLPVLKPLEIPDDVKDESGELNAECKEVRWLCAHVSHAYAVLCRADAVLCGVVGG
jgi:hypothetical protein